MPSKFVSVHTVLLTGVLLVGPSLAKGPSFVRVKDAKQDADFAIQGEYSGEVKVNGNPMTLALQVVAMGKGQFHTARYVGGLPGDGWNGKKLTPLTGKLADDGTLTFTADGGQVVLKDGEFSFTYRGESAGTLKKVHRKSPTLGKKPPEGAIVLFDGTSGGAWKDGEMDGTLLTEGQTSKQEFGSHSLHIEFRLPYEPENRSQGRGNSGLYLQGRYEVQMLDSFGLSGEHNECGGVYTIAPPAQNMCFPPLTWQTYDVDFTAAKYDNAGKLLQNPLMTVRHNGIVVHQDLELPKKTTAAPRDPGPGPGPVYLQDHTNPVRYRNIWVVPKSDATN